MRRLLFMLLALLVMPLTITFFCIKWTTRTGKDEWDNYVRVMRKLIYTPLQQWTRLDYLILWCTALYSGTGWTLLGVLLNMF